jgi:SAM-dependent methyltransferase
MKTHHRCRLSPAQLSASLHQWYGTLAGQDLLDAIKGSLDRVLPGLFGYYALQVGCVSAETDMLEYSRVKHRLYVDVVRDQTQVMGVPEALPLQGDSIDLVLLMHSLDFTRDPHRILREVDRVLIPEGHVVVVGFNPVSLYGLWKGFLLWQRRVPWCGRFYSGARIRDWMSLLGLETLDVQHVGFRPPIQRPGLSQRLEVLERMGMVAAPYFGAVRILLAQKRVATLTPIRPRWGPRRSILAGNLPEPTPRQAQAPRGRAG